MRLRTRTPSGDEIRSGEVGVSSSLSSPREMKSPPPLLPPVSSFYSLYKDGVTQGSITRFMVCPEKHRLGQVEGLSPYRIGGALAFGSLVHEALDMVYKDVRSFSYSSGSAFDPRDANQFAVQRLRVHLKYLEARDRQELYNSPLEGDKSEEELNTNYGLAEVILSEYFSRWKKDLTQYKWLSLEEVFSVPYISARSGLTIPVRGKFDGVFRSGQRLWLFETKTKSRIEEDSIVDQLSYNMQVCLYLWAIEEIYQQVPAGVVYNLIRKPQIKRAKRESLPQFLSKCQKDIRQRPDFYFIRYEAFIDQDDMLRWKREFDSIIHQIEGWHSGLFHYRNSTSCSGRYGDCEFLPVCSRGDVSRLQRREVPFPELVQIEQPEGE